MTMQKELDALLDDVTPNIEEPTPPPEAPPTEPPAASSQDQPPEELPTDTPPPTEPPAMQAEAPTDQTPPSEPPTADKSSNLDEMSARLDALVKQNQELMKQLNEVAAGRYTPPAQPTSAPSGPPAATPSSQGREGTPAGPAPFLESEDDFNRVLDKVENFNALLENVVKRAKAEAAEEALLSLPRLAEQLVNQQLTLRMAADEFYKVNADLAPYRNFVGFVTNEVAAAHPEYDLRTLLDESAKEVRNRIGLTGMQPPPTAPAAPAAPSAPGGPAFAPGPGARPGRTAQPKISGQEQQILDLLQDL